MHVQRHCVSYALAFVLLAASAGACAHREASAREPVRIAWNPVVGSLPLFVALDRDYFAANDIDIEAIAFSNSNDAVNALVAGQVDVIPAVSLVPVIHLELQHPGSVRVFSQSRSTPDRASDSIVVRGDAPLHALSDLEGRKMGVFPGTSATRLLSAFLAREGVETDNITFVPLPPASHLSALESQSVDALFTYEPTTTVARVSGRFRTLHGSVYASLLNPSPLGAAIVSRRFEQERPLVARRTIAAFDDAVEYMRRHEAQAKELIPRFLTLQVELARQVTVVESGLSSENDVQALQRLIELLHAVGELPAVFDAEQLVELGP